MRQDESWTNPPVIILSAVADEPDQQADIAAARSSMVLHKLFDVEFLITGRQARMTA